MTDRRTFIAVLAGLTFRPSAEASEPTLNFGIMPFNSALTLIKSHQPLREHLQNQLGRKIDLLTSPDYFTFVNDLAEGRFDLAIAAPHFALLAKQKGYLPLLRYQADLEFIVVIPASQNWQVTDLRGKRIGIPSRLTIAAISGVQWLRDHNLMLGQDFFLREYPTHGAAVAAVAVGDVDAAVVAVSALRQNPPDVQRRVRPIESVLRMPHLMTLVHRRLPETLIKRIRLALLAFPTTPAGAEFMHATGYLGYIEAGDPERLRHYWETARRLMVWRE